MSTWNAFFFLSGIGAVLAGLLLYGMLALFGASRTRRRFVLCIFASAFVIVIWAGFSFVVPLGSPRQQVVGKVQTFGQRPSIETNWSYHALRLRLEQAETQIQIPGRTLTLPFGPSRVDLEIHPTEALNTAAFAEGTGVRATYRYWDMTVAEAEILDGTHQGWSYRTGEPVPEMTLALLICLPGVAIGTYAIGKARRKPLNEAAAARVGDALTAPHQAEVRSSPTESTTSRTVQQALAVNRSASMDDVLALWQTEHGVATSTDVWQLAAELKRQGDGALSPVAGEQRSWGTLSRAEAAERASAPDPSLSLTTAGQSYDTESVARRRQRPLWVVAAMPFALFGPVWYPCVWLGTTWAEMKRELGESDMHPVWHALALAVPLYGLFIIHEHFEKINWITTTRTNVAPSAHSGLAVIGMFLSSAVGAAGRRLPDESGVYTVALALLSTAILAAVLVHGQSALNAYWRALPDRNVPKRTHWAEIVGVLGGVWLNIPFFVAVAALEHVGA